MYIRVFVSSKRGPPGTTLSSSSAGSEVYKERKPAPELTLQVGP